MNISCCDLSALAIADRFSTDTISFDLKSWREHHSTPLFLKMLRKKRERGCCGKFTCRLGWSVTNT
jgi:hypothetical protein